MTAWASPRMRIVLATALCCLAGAIILPVTLRTLFGLPASLFWLMLKGYLAGAAGMTLSVAVTAWVTLWPATPYMDLRPGEPEPRGADPREAKLAVLALPSWVATAGTTAGELATIAGWLYLTMSGQRDVPTASVSLLTGTLVGLSWLLLYSLVQRAAAPLLHRLRDVHPTRSQLEAEPGLQGRLGYALFIAVWAGVVPVSTFAAAYLNRVQKVEVQAGRERTRATLSQLARALEAQQLDKVLESELSFEVSVVASTGAEDPHAAPLPLQGDRLAILSPPEPPPLSLELLGVVVGLLILCGVLGRRTATIVAHDVAGLARRALNQCQLRPGEITQWNAAGSAQRSGVLATDSAQRSGVLATDSAQRSGVLATDSAQRSGVLATDSAQRSGAPFTDSAQRSGVLSTGSAQRSGAPFIDPPQCDEALQVAAALDRLMDRMRRLHVESYLAIERTVDARRAKSQFLASMSHDLRSPLSSVLGFSELLSSGYEGDIPETARARLLHLHRTGRRLLRLLSEILDTAKVESQTIELHPRRCTAADLLTQAVAEARRGRMHDDLPVVLDIAPGMRPVNVDPVRFPQALAHLISHVLDGATLGKDQDRLQDPEQPIPGVQVRITASEGAADDPSFIIDVAVERMPGTAGEEPQLPLGTVGLGLALPLSRRLFALHGGTIEVVAAHGGHRACLRATVPLRPA